MPKQTGKIKENLQTIIAVCILVGMVISGLAYFAKASDLRQVEYRVDKKSIRDDIKWAYYELDSLFKDHGMRNTRDCNRLPAPSDDTCRNIKRRIEELQRELGKVG